MLVNGSSILTNGLTTGMPADAGAIYNDHGTVTLVACTVTNNSAEALYVGGIARGGAIFNNGGNLSLFQTEISNNMVVGGGINGAISLNGIDFGLGGAIYNTNGTVVMMGCNIMSNLCQGLNAITTVSNVAFPLPPIQQNASGYGLTMGGAVYQASGSLTITSSSFSFNQGLGGNGASPMYYLINGCPAYGGALATAGGSITIEQSQFFMNMAIGGDAGYHNTAGPAFGGAIYSAAVLAISDSSFFGNQALAGNYSEAPNSPGWMGVNGNGGGIYNSGTAVLNRCAVYSNYVQGGSGVAYPGAYVNGGNGLGGGIFNASQCAATNCTITLNSVVGGDGEYDSGSVATNGQAIGGGVFNNTSAVFIAMNLTVASNSCNSPLPVYLTTNGIAAGTQIANADGMLALLNSIIAGTNSNAYGPITDDGFNVCSDGSANLNSGASYNFTDPHLGPLANYGGTTLCMALLPDSPAIDSADPSDFPTTDQRGFIRPIGDGPDMGAFEYGSYQPVNPYLNITSATNSVVLIYITALPGSYRLQASTNLTTWIDLNTNGPFSAATNISQTISAQGFNTRFFRLLVQ